MFKSINHVVCLYLLNVKTVGPNFFVATNMTPGKVFERLKAKKNCVKKKNIFFSDMDYEYLRSVRCFNYFLIGGDFCRSLTKSSDNF